MLKSIRRHLGIKLFLSYLLVILAGAVVLVLSTEFAIPTAFDRHMAGMSAVMESRMNRSMPGVDLRGSLFANFRTAVREALTWAALAALLAAGWVSWLLSRQVTIPVKEMQQASQKIAAGSYQERVSIPGDPLQTDELSQLALSFNRMAERLERTEDRRRMLIADITHELRTPLTAIQGSLEGLLDEVLPAQPSTYQRINQEAERLSRLVDDLQELSRIEAEAYSLNPQPTAVDHLLNTIRDRLQQQFEDKGVRLRIEREPDFPPVVVDEKRIDQVFLNVVGNALQYTPSGGWVRIKAEEADGKLQYTIEDSGIGIAAEDLPHIFTRFYRVDKSRSRASGGSGIGLTISRHLIEAHGGRIWAESDGLGRGSRFIFTLPASSSGKDPL
jgi:histidine kinase